MFRTILVPTDFSDRADAALKTAALLAREYGARVVLLHSAVAPSALYGEAAAPILPADWRANMKKALDQVPPPEPAVRLERRIEDGDPASTILRVAKEVGADLIVLGTHGRTGISRFLLGSVAEAVLRRAECAVMTVKTPFPTEAGNGRRAGATAVAK
jgi:nucleotide-binding universal stress UspA family protein